MRWIISFIVAINILASCKNEENSSPYSDILALPAYQPLTDSIKKEPEDDELYFRRAILLNKDNYPEPALADFQKAWSLKKLESYAVGISNILLEKNTTEAITFLNNALKELPKSIFLQLTLSRAYDSQGKTDEALKVTNDILTDQPNQANALILQSELYQKKNDGVNAASSMEKAFTIASNNTEIAYKLSYLYAENKNPKVIALTDSLIASDSLKQFEEPLYVRGLYYSNIKDYAKALKWFDETIKRHYNYLNAYIEKGKIFLEQKKLADALRTFALANRLTPSFPDAWYWLGRTNELMGNKEEAKTNYEKAYELDNTFTEAKEAGEKIKSQN